MWRSVQNFLARNLGQSAITEDMIKSIAAARTQSGPGVSREAVVAFKQVEVRDQ